MRTYVLRRLLALVPTLFFASLIVFFTIRLIPGDVIDLMLSQNDVAADKMSRDQVIAALGLDRPMWEQYLRWVSGIVFHGDLGRSLWQGTPVTEFLAARLPVTFELGLIALVVGLLIALPIGVYSAVRQDTRGDLLARSFSIVLLAVPSFWLGTVVVVFPSIWWGWSPEVDFVRLSDNPLQNLRRMLIPGVILGASLSAVTMRLTRTMMLVRGEVPSALRPPSGCRFHTRCPRALERCRSDDPPPLPMAGGRAVACHLHASGASA